MPVVGLPLANPTPTPTPPPGASSPDVIAAIVALWAADPNLPTVSANLFLDIGPAGGPYPFAVLMQSGSRTLRDTSLVYLEQFTIQFSLYHTSDDDLATYAGWVQAVFDPLARSKALTFNNGTLKDFRRTGGTFRSLGRVGRDGAIVYQQVINYTVMVQRTESS